MGRYLVPWFLLYWTDNGHDLNSLIPILKKPKIKHEGPILIHVKTKKVKATLLRDSKR